MGYSLKTLREEVQHGTKLTELPPPPHPNPGNSQPHDRVPSSGKDTPTMPEFSLSAMQEYLVKFIVADDQVCSSDLCCWFHF